MIGEAVSRALGVGRVHPWVTLALGVALVLAVASAFTGLGVVLFPWFVCEVFALSLAASGVPVQPRGRAWLRASLVVLAIAVVFGSVVVLAALVFGPDVSTADRAAVLPWGQALLRLAGITSISVAALVYALPFAHVPIVLLERGGTVGEAALESVLLVRQAGVPRTFRLVLVAAIFALLPSIGGAIVTARMLDRASTPLGVVASLPLLLFSLPAGLGLVAQGYLLHRHLLPARHLVRARPLARTTSVLLTSATIAPIGGLVLLLWSCTLPAPLLRSELPPTARVVAERAVGSDAAQGIFSAPGTTLSFAVAPRGVEVRPALEGATTLLRAQSARRPIVEARVLALGDVFAVELLSAGHRSEGWALLDLSGARLDDTTHRALAERMGVWRALVFGPSFLVIALGLLAALGPLAELRGRGPRDERDAANAEARALRLAWALVPCWATIVTLGALALLGV
ncbi:MAG: hypothetical protein IT372_36900 [Polyangiaceae bacterium]|nr:hypothetical protein [Polyangiaceae bacterium]